MSPLFKYLILGIFLFIQTTSIAQEPVLETYITTVGDTVVIQLVAITDVVSVIEASSRRIRNISNGITPDKDIVKLDSLIIIDKPLIIAEIKRIDKVTESITIKNIEDVKREWEMYNKKYASKHEKISERINWFESELQFLFIRVQTWRLTKKSFKNENIPDEIIDRINSTIDTYKKLESKLKKRQSEVIIIQNEIADFTQKINEIQVRLDEILFELQSQILVQDSPLFWNTRDSTMQLSILKYRFEESLNENIRVVNSFLPKNKNRAITHLVIVIFIIILLYILNSRFKQLNLSDDENKYKNVKYVLYHYIASTSLLGLIITTWLYPDVQTSVRELMILLLLIPSAFLIPVLAKGRIKILLFIILFIFFINEILFFYQAKLFFARIALLIENGVMIWVLYKIVMPSSDAKSMLMGRWWAWIINVAKLFLLFLAGSIISNVFGFMNLAIILNKTVVSALLFAIVLSLFVVVVNSAVIILLKSKFLQQSNIIFKYNLFVEQKILVIVQITIFFLLLRAILKSTDFLTNVYNWLVEFIVTDWKVGPISFSISNILGFFILLIVTYLIAKAVKILLEEEIFPYITLPRGVPGAITMLSGYFIVGSGIILAFSVAGIDLSKFSLMAGALGVGIGFGLQNVVYNFISGLILAFERPVQLGDTIEVGTLMGNVKEIGIRSSTVRAFDGSEVIVPNGNLISKELINWSLSDKRRRREVKVGVAYGTHPQDVLDLLLEVANAHEKVLKVPKPLCLFDSFGESSLDFRLLFWVPLEGGLTIQSEVTMAVYKAIEEAGMQIPFPQHDLHIKLFDPTVQKIVFPKLINKDKKEET